MPPQEGLYLRKEIGCTDIDIELYRLEVPSSNKLTG